MRQRLSGERNVSLSGLEAVTSLSPGSSWIRARSSEDRQRVDWHAGGSLHRECGDGQ